MSKSVFEMNREELQEYNDKKLYEFKELFENTNKPVNEIYSEINVDIKSITYNYINGMRKRLGLSSKNRNITVEVIEEEKQSPNPHKSLCKQCIECEDYEYIRFDRKGNLQCFQYCNGGAKEVELSNWYIQKDGYAYSTKRILDGKKTFYHTLFKQNKDMIIDHIDGDRTDNRLRMLREVTSSENSQNLHLLWKDKRIVSKFPGVYYNRKHECWTCQARKHKANHPDSIHVKKDGFKTEYEAFECYINILNNMGRAVNTETDVYQDYLQWKSRQQQSTLEAFI